MKVMVLTILMFLYGRTAHAGEVTLQWDQHPDPDLDYYTLYQAEKYELTTGPWHKSMDIEKHVTTAIVTVDDDKAFAWYLTATGLTKAESGPSNTVEIYERKRMTRPTCLSLP